MTCSVYIFQTTIGGKSLAKIGISKDPYQRLRTIRTYCPGVIDNASLVTFEKRRDAEVLEKMIHREMAHRKTSGEWFEEGPDFNEALGRAFFSKKSPIRKGSKIETLDVSNGKIRTELAFIK